MQTLKAEKIMKQSHPNLQWNIHSLREGNNNFHFLLQEKDLDLNLEGARIKEPIECTITLTKQGTKIILDGSARFLFELECARCFASFTLDREERMSAYYLPTKPSSGEREKLSKADVLTEYYEDDIVDAQPLLHDIIALSKPMKPLCSETCKGLCPLCGKNLNRAQCTCKKEETDPRWEPLKKLMNK
jgi:uncharacterized protein